MKKRICILSLATVIAGLFVTPVFAEGRSSIVYTANIYLSFTFGHNPAGFWCLEDNSGSAVISDESMGTGSPVCSGSALMIYTLPGEVVEALREDPSLRVRIERPEACSCLDFSFLAYRFSGPGTLDMELRIKPVISKSYFLNDFVPGLTAPLPLVDYRYGSNIYIVYPLIGGSSFARGFFSEENPSWISSPLVHPSRIKDSSGHFRSGTTINVDGVNRNAAFYTIGKKGVLSFEEAVLLHFDCPLKLVFYRGEEQGEELPPGNGGWTVWEGSPEEEELQEKPFSLRIHRKK